jgi:hypothetical protein
LVYFTFYLCYIFMNKTRKRKIHKNKPYLCMYFKICMYSCFNKLLVFIKPFSYFIFGSLGYSNQNFYEYFSKIFMIKNRVVIFVKNHSVSYKTFNMQYSSFTYVSVSTSFASCINVVQGFSTQVSKL